MVINILGVRGQILEIDPFLKLVAKLEEQNKFTLQFFRADRIFSAEHLVSAAEKAERAMQNGMNMSKTLGMEVMLYAAAEHQTSEALRKFGIFPGITEMGLVVIGEMSEDKLLSELGIERDDSVLGPEGKDPTIFGITPDEIETLGKARIPEMVLEKIALSEVQR